MEPCYITEGDLKLFLPASVEVLRRQADTTTSGSSWLFSFPESMSRGRGLLPFQGHVLVGLWVSEVWAEVEPSDLPCALGLSAPLLPFPTASPSPLTHASFAQLRAAFQNIPLTASQFTPQRKM